MEVFRVLDLVLGLASSGDEATRGLGRERRWILGVGYWGLDTDDDAQGAARWGLGFKRERGGEGEGETLWKSANDGTSTR